MPTAFGTIFIWVQVPRGNAGRQVTDGRLRCLATQAAVSVMSKAKDSVNPIGIPQVRLKAIVPQTRLAYRWEYDRFVAVSFLVLHSKRNDGNREQ